MDTKLKRNFIGSIVPVIILLGLAACGGTDPGAGPAGPYWMDTSGGTGGDNAGSGGAGGLVIIQKNGGTGALDVLTTGSVDASFTYSSPLPNLGTTFYTVSSDTTIPLGAGSAFPPNDPYMSPVNFNLYISDGSLPLYDETPVTGIQINAGVTLTLPLNSGGTTGKLTFVNDINNLGTITSVDVGPGQRGAIELIGDNYIGGPSSSLDTGATAPGETTGWITVTAQPGGFYNKGTISTAGADDGGGSGTNGQSIGLTAETDFENTGAITSRGGNSILAAGGSGGDIVMATQIGHLYNAGNVDARGGDGGVNAGWGGGVEISTGLYGVQFGGSGGAGALLNSGVITTVGGIASGGPGGNGGAVSLTALGDGLRNSANINSSGGNTDDPPSSGGTGGEVKVHSLPGVNSGDLTTQAGDLLFAGDINTFGGNTASTGTGSGGIGGAIEIILDASGSLISNTYNIGVAPSGPPANPRLSVLSTLSITTKGGSGNTGGNGGVVAVIDVGERWDPTDFVPPYDFLDDPGGNVANEVDITTRGGNVVATAFNKPALAGAAGAVAITSDSDGTLDAGTEFLTNSGDIDTSGGDALELTTALGINGGSIGLNATNNIENSGTLTANGGNDLVNDGSSTTGFGYNANVVGITSLQAAVTNTGTVSAKGGDGEGQGGTGAIGLLFLTPGVLLSAATDLSNSGNISVAGGNADAVVSNSVGGNGGSIQYTFSVSGTFTNTGSNDISGGIGDLPSSAGSCQENAAACPP